MRGDSRGVGSDSLGRVARLERATSLGTVTLLGRATSLGRVTPLERATSLRTVTPLDRTTSLERATFAWEGDLVWPSDSFRSAPRGRVNSLGRTTPLRTVALLGRAICPRVDSLRSATRFGDSLAWAGGTLGRATCLDGSLAAAGRLAQERGSRWRVWRQQRGAFGRRLDCDGAMRVRRAPRRWRWVWRWWRRRAGRRVRASRV
jgi:hypothetical protein